EVCVRLVNDEDAVIFSVADTGRGIAPEFLPYVFERFRQADSSTTRQFGGLGLGLAIVRHIVELHGGNAEAASEGEGKGATFRVRLPRPSAPLSDDAFGEAPTETKGTTLPTRLDGAKVCVVDDDADARELLAAILERHGATVSAFASASEARAALAHEQPDAILCDVTMPDEDGYAFVHALRALPREKGGATPAVA